MKITKTLMLVSFLIMAFIFNLTANAAIHVVAAENFYGSIAKQLGGSYVSVESIINNPNQNPHLFIASAKIKKSLSKNPIIIYNGAGYDSWINPLLQAQSDKSLEIINVASLVGIKEGANPHIWYDPNNMAFYAKKLTAVLIQEDATHKKYYETQLQQFITKNNALLDRIRNLKSKTNGMFVIATEPVFGYMASLLGFTMEGLAVQWEVMNNTTSTPKEIKDYEDYIIKNEVKLLFYNNQVTEPLTNEIKALAEEHHIPIVGVSETQPLNMKTYHQWMNSELDAIMTTIK